MIIVAQRVGTILHADQIIVLDRARSSAIGTHDELMETSETYREIVYSQLTEEEVSMSGPANGSNGHGPEPTGTDLPAAASGRRDRRPRTGRRCPTGRPGRPRRPGRPTASRRRLRPDGPRPGHAGGKGSRLPRHVQPPARRAPTRRQWILLVIVASSSAWPARSSAPSARATQSTAARRSRRQAAGRAGRPDQSHARSGGGQRSRRQHSPLADMVAGTNATPGVGVDFGALGHDPAAASSALYLLSTLLQLGGRSTSMARRLAAHRLPAAQARSTRSSPACR